MVESLLKLSDSELRGIASSMRAGRIASPFSAMALQRVISSENAEYVAVELESLRAQGADPAAISVMLELLVQDRQRRPLVEDVIDLVTTGPEACGVTNRDTSVVVRELFANAKRSVLVVGYAVYQGQRVFAALADRMNECPQLHVRLLLDIQRPSGDTSAPNEIVRRFADRFVTTQWPADRPLPTLYYYPVSLESESGKRSSLHAKCVVVDGEAAFVSSANFTEAAQERNIEVGLIMRSTLLAGRITRHFDALISEGFMTSLLLPRTS